MRFAPVLLITAACTAVGLVAATPDGARWWSYVEFLASDKLEGRNTGSEGHRKAAEYVAGQFERDGLKPAGEQGYIQPVKFITKELDETHSTLTLERDGKSQALKLGEDAIIGTGADPAPSVEAGMVFIGYGLNVPEIRYNDFAGLDTKGKIAVYMGGAPGELSSALAAHQYNFIRHGIPSLMPTFGAAKGSPEEQVFRKWNTERYHAPSDDLNQSVDKAAAAQFNDLVARLLERVANADSKPAWKQTSFFKRYAN